MARTRRPAKPTAPIKPIAERVVRVTSQVPKFASTRIVDDSMDHAWLVGCENPTCTYTTLAAKYDYHPVDFADPDGDMVKREFRAPGRRFCGLHMG